MKIVLLCGGQHNQVALANKVAAGFELAGIVIEKPVAKKLNKFSFSQLVEKILNRTIFLSIHNTWFNLLDLYKKEYPHFPATETITVSNINSDDTVDFIRKIQPDIIMVSGTAMVKKKVLSLQVPKGIINLHTGLSPYIKGGPNCTNWCIAEEKFHLIGNTIMWIDAGIDSGDIITTGITALDGKENILQLHKKVMDHAHELYLRALDKIENDFNNCTRVKQASICEGTTYYSKQWNRNAKWRLLKNISTMSAYFQSAQYKKDIAAIKTVDL